jgi:hypothetical protein
MASISEATPVSLSPRIRRQTSRAITDAAWRAEDRLGDVRPSELQARRRALLGLEVEGVQEQEASERGKRSD